MERPKVGVGVLIINQAGKILVGKRKGKLAPYYSIPGGHLELGETFEEAAIKEVYEETGLKIKNPTVFCVTNNLDTYKKENKHYVSISLITSSFEGEPIAREPDKCEQWEWVDPINIPQPHFDASQQTIQCYLDKVFYLEQKHISKSSN